MGVWTPTLPYPHTPTLLLEEWRNSNPGDAALGLIVGDRGFFPDHLCEKGHAEVLKVLAEEGFRVAALSPEETPFGSVETRRAGTPVRRTLPAARGQHGRGAESRPPA
ncbi:MAG: hypothetical protein HY321_04960 [Armatimonadetes bacterium]|nr:hypothetical protein [Armatimonadota bacterium]